MAHVKFLAFFTWALQMANATTELTSQYPLYDIEVDNETGAVFLGGENVILRVTKELQLEKSVSTGPVKDHPDCRPPRVPPDCGLERVLTKNRNKILLIDKGRRNLITCGSVYFGACQLRDLNTLSTLREVNDQSVASSSPSSSIAFIAPGSTDDKPVMYVGATWEKNSPLVFSQAAVASRNLDNGLKLFHFVETSQLGDTTSHITFKDPQSFIVKYIYGFSSGTFSYFVQVQQTLKSYEGRDNRYHTTIGRVCQRDKEYASYVEMPLVCQSSSGEEYNIAQSAFLSKPGKFLSSELGSNGDALFVAFGNSSLGSPNATRFSAMCVYSIEDINQKLSENIKKCFSDSKQNEGMPWANGGGEACIDSPSTDTSEPFCPGTKITFNYPNHPIGGEIPVTASATFLYDSASLTAIVAMPVNDYTAVFLGTAHGHLLKASTDNGICEDATVDQGGAVKRLKFSADTQAVYALSNKKVAMVPLQNCKVHTSCNACVKRNDPFCGWCTLYKKCSQLSECTSASLDPSRFARKTSQCVDFTSVTPDKIPVGTNTELKIVMSNLPPLLGGEEYKCYINNAEQQSKTTSPGKLECGIPEYKDLPPITGSKGAVLVDLALYSTETKVLFVSRKIAFYDCSKIKRCRDCSEGEYACDWCLFQVTCSGNGTAVCPADVVLSTENRPPNSRGCPRLESNQAIYIPEGLDDTIVLKGQDLPETKAGLDYKCVVNVGGTDFDVSATRNSETQLTCTPRKYSYTQSLQQKEATLSVWRGKQEVYRPGNISVTLYKCHVGRTDCSICLVADERFKCGWCPLKGPCVVERAGCKSSWIPRNLNCNTKPNITKVWPMASPWSGETEIEIHGVDLGKSFDDIKDTVTIGKYKCITDPNKYEPARRIHCNTTASNEAARDFVTVEINGMKGKSPYIFSYQNPEVLDFEPKKGPQSGGSLITITGNKLNTGRNIEAYIGSTRCVLLDRMSVTDNSLKCLTDAVSVRERKATNNTNSGPISVTLAFDGYEPPSPSAKFVFTPDPVVDSIYPTSSILSGGLKLEITGNHFDSILEPKIFFTNPATKNTTKAKACQRLSNIELICLSPNAFAIHVTPDSRNGSEVILGFIMDGVKGLNNFTMAIKQDPVFDPFPDGVKEVKESLILGGNHLEGILKRDIRVTVEGIKCNTTSTAEYQVVCLLPKPDKMPDVQDGLYVVEVVIGNRKYNPGKMKFFDTDGSGISLYVYIGIAVAAVLVIVIVILCCMYYKQRKLWKMTIETSEIRMNNLKSDGAEQFREERTLCRDLQEPVDRATPALYQPLSENLLGPSEYLEP